MSRTKRTPTDPPDPSRPAPALAATADLRRLLDFLDSYAAEHPEFARRLQAALAPESTAPVSPPARSRRAPAAAPRPLPNPVELYLSGGEAGLRGALAELTPREWVQTGKALGLRLTQKGGLELATERIVERVRQELGRGSAFSRTPS